VASLSQGRTAAAQCGLFTHKSVPVIFEPPCTNVQVYFIFFYKIYCISTYTSLYTLVGFISYNKRVFIHKIISDEKLPLHSTVFHVGI